jgi:hypothetical protein
MSSSLRSLLRWLSAPARQLWWGERWVTPSNAIVREALGGAILLPPVSDDWDPVILPSSAGAAPPAPSRFALALAAALAPPLPPVAEHVEASAAPVEPPTAIEQPAPKQGVAGRAA